eukprot:767592-Hanusia_phi.AAC.2
MVTSRTERESAWVSSRQPQQNEEQEEEQYLEEATREDEEVDEESEVKKEETVYLHGSSMQQPLQGGRRKGSPRQTQRVEEDIIAAMEEQRRRMEENQDLGGGRRFVCLKSGMKDRDGSPGTWRRDEEEDKTDGDEDSSFCHAGRAWSLGETAESVGGGSSTQSRGSGWDGRGDRRRLMGELWEAEAIVQGGGGGGEGPGHGEAAEAAGNESADGKGDGGRREPWDGEAGARDYYGGSGRGRGKDLIRGETRAGQGEKTRIWKDQGERLVDGNGNLQGGREIHGDVKRRGDLGAWGGTRGSETGGEGAGGGVGSSGRRKAVVMCMDCGGEFRFARSWKEWERMRCVFCSDMLKEEIQEVHMKKEDCNQEQTGQRGESQQSDDTRKQRKEREREQEQEQEQERRGGSRREGLETGEPVNNGGHEHTDLQAPRHQESGVNRDLGQHRVSVPSAPFKGANEREKEDGENNCETDCFIEKQQIEELACSNINCTSLLHAQGTLPWNFADNLAKVEECKMYQNNNCDGIQETDEDNLDCKQNADVRVCDEADKEGQETSQSGTAWQLLDRQDGVLALEDGRFQGREEGSKHQEEEERGEDVERWEQELAWEMRQHGKVEREIEGRQKNGRAEERCGRLEEVEAESREEKVRNRVLLQTGQIRFSKSAEIDVGKQQQQNKE